MAGFPASKHVSKAVTITLSLNNRPLAMLFKLSMYFLERIS